MKAFGARGIRSVLAPLGLRPAGRGLLLADGLDIDKEETSVAF